MYKCFFGNFHIARIVLVIPKVITIPLYIEVLVLVCPAHTTESIARTVLGISKANTIHGNCFTCSAFTAG